MSDGWIKLHRQIADNDIWFSEPFTKAQAWIDLFLHANHKDGSIDIRGNTVQIKRGQLGWSELTMSKRWKWSRKKVRNFLKRLEMEQQIVQRKDRFITTIITILNYKKFQDGTAECTAEEQQKNSRGYINKNEKNEKKYIYRTLKKFREERVEVIKRCLKLYPNRTKENLLESYRGFVEYCEIHKKASDYKDYYLAFCKCVREGWYIKEEEKNRKSSIWDKPAFDPSKI